MIGTASKTTQRTTAINAAFLREIKEEDCQLWKLLDHVELALSEPARVAENPEKVLVLLGQFQQQLRGHFQLEEVFGYCNIDPAVASRDALPAEALRAQHGTLLTALCSVIERAEAMLADWAYSTGGALRVAFLVSGFCEQLFHHEAAENQMIRRLLAESQADSQAA